jgi:hypothetical protein
MFKDFKEFAIKGNVPDGQANPAFEAIRCGCRAHGTTASHTRRSFVA